MKSTLVCLTVLTAVHAQIINVPLTRSKAVEPITRMHHKLKKLKAGNERERSGSQVKLQNFGDVSYSGPVQFGIPAQGYPESLFVYDTGSGFLTVNGADCEVCESQYYDPNLSDHSE
jgi:hypothetical protein